MIYPQIEDRDELVGTGLLRCDDLDDLRVYTYTDRCKTWTDTTLNSRGIIYNRKTGEVVARPFPKFFNMDQRRETQEHNLPWKNGFRIFLKEDGWMGTLFRHAGQHRIATRGSFKSPGAVWATEHLKRYDLSGLPDEVTLVFELISPITRIVVDYGDREDLVLLAGYNRHTGEEYPWAQIEEWSEQFGFTLVESFDQNWLGYCRGQLKKRSGARLEGYVIRFANGLRVKIKSEDYFRRSRLIQNLTPLKIWGTMVNGQVQEEVWGIVDLDYHEQLDQLAERLAVQYKEVETVLQDEFAEIEHETDRAAFAILAKRTKHPAAMFAMFDEEKRKVDNYVMGLIRPHNNVFVEGA